MSYTALYRKWRPVTFQDVKGQDHIVQTLKNQILSARIGHAYLFCGTRGTGKTSVAKILAKAVNCESPVDGNPCGICGSCKSIAAAASMNVVEIDAASNNGVENIREIREQVQYPPTEGTYRVYIIDEVHMLSTGAFNALLKTLEEPPSYVIFILATTEVHKIPITVLSRCQRYDFKRISLDTIAGYLKDLTEAEALQVEEKALRYVAKAADGALRDALSLLDQCVAFHFGKTLTYENVLEVLGAVDNRIFSEMFRNIIKDDTGNCIRNLEELVIQGRELGQFVVDFIWFLRNLLLLKTAGDAEGLLEMSEDALILLREEAGLVDGETLMRFIRVFSELSNQLRYAAQKRVLIEIALIKLTRPQMEANLDSILQRVSQIEEQLESGTFAVNSAGGTAAGQITSAPGVGRVSYSNGESFDGAGEPVQTPPPQVTITKAQLEDLNMIRDGWGNMIKELGGSIRAGFRNTVVEPNGDSCLCVVFADPSSFAIGSRPTALGELERFVERKYQKSIIFKARLKDGGERLNTIYISDEDLRENIHMDISIED